MQQGENMKNKVMNLLKASATISIFFLAACGNSQTAVVPETSAPANTSNPTSPVLNTDLHLDPANADPNLYPVVINLYEGLVKEDNGQITGVLASSYTSSEDGLDYIFNLRPGVTFHDGASLNADAVIVNFNRWFDSKSPTHG